MYVFLVITSLGLKVKLPMKLEPDFNGAVDSANSSSVVGFAQHVDVRLNYIEMKIMGYNKIKYQS